MSFSFASSTTQPSNNTTTSDGSSAFGFGTTNTSATTTTGLGASNNSQQTSFNFGDATQPATTTTSSTSNAGFHFGTSKRTSGFASSTNVNTTATTQNNSLVFGQAQQQPSFQAPTTGFGFSFGTAFSNNEFTFISNLLKTSDIPFNDPTHFSDLVIEILINTNGLVNIYTSIFAHRIIVCAASEVLSRMTKPKGDKNVIEIVCSDITEAFYAQTMITCLYKSTSVKIQDVFILYDLFEKYGIRSCNDVIISNMRNQAEKNQDAAFECLKYIQRVPFTKISESLLSLVYSSLSCIKRGITSHGSSYQIEEVLRNLDYYFIEGYLKKSCQGFHGDITILDLINVWVKSNIEEHRNESYIVPIVEIFASQQSNSQIAIQLMSILSCENPHYEFLNLVTADRRLRIINKICGSLLSNTFAQPTATQTPTFPQTTNIQTPVGFF